MGVGGGIVTQKVLKYVSFFDIAEMRVVIAVADWRQASTLRVALWCRNSPWMSSAAGGMRWSRRNGR